MSDTLLDFSFCYSCPPSSQTSERYGCRFREGEEGWLRTQLFNRHSDVSSKSSYEMKVSVSLLFSSLLSNVKKENAALPGDGFSPKMLKLFREGADGSGPQPMAELIKTEVFNHLEC